MTSDSSKLQQRITVLEDELNLIKSEIHQTLVDMRDAMSKGQDILSVKKEAPAPKAQPQAAQQQEDNLSDVDEPTETDSIDEEELEEDGVESLAIDSLDHYSEEDSIATLSKPSPAAIDFKTNKALMDDILSWIGTAKEKGFTAARLFPVMEAYETSGLMNPLMTKFLLKSMSMLDEIQDKKQPATLSPSDYAQCLSELHHLITGEEEYEEEDYDDSTDSVWGHV
ncbi:MAG: hypothetical protein ACJ0A6_02335 [Dehalococcoidia bacterium]|tara:strand:+ start:750 stop:1424 length:675 start_codon:yes stop_codon:yes gene_type:complete